MLSRTRRLTIDATEMPRHGLLAADSLQGRMDVVLQTWVHFGSALRQKLSRDWFMAYFGHFLPSRE